jgi:hypothetical protein
MTTSYEELTVKEGGPATGKRKEPPHQDEADFGDASPHKEAPSLHDLSRSEKKREREKKRREDVNRGFDHLMSLIFMIDPELKAEAEDRQRKSLGDLLKTKPEALLLSRIELINAAIATLQRVHDENEKRKMTIAVLSKGLLYTNSGSAGPPPPVMPPMAPHVYSHNMARPPNMQVIPYRFYLLAISALTSAFISSASCCSRIAQDFHSSWTLLLCWPTQSLALPCERLFETVTPPPTSRNFCLPHWFLHLLNEDLLH